MLVAVAMMIHKQATLETVTALLHNALLMFLLGIIALASGLAMILTHNVWSGGTLAVVVTLIGWVTLVKGLLFVFLPPEMEAEFFLNTLRYEHLFYMYTVISFLLGVYLTYGGFFSSGHFETPRQA
jgi:hypothetical protein